MAEEKVIGGPLSPGVLAQLAIRNKIMSKSDRNNEDLLYLNSRTGWAKMSSGVDVEGSNKLAKEYTLVAGQYGKHGSDSYSNYTETLGFRPMPGITGVEVRSINRFGVLKEATVNFTCWSVQQLTDLELLYMRPGFTLLLEWGHSIYSKNGKAPYDRNVEYVTNFFDEKGLSKQIVYDEIEQLKKQSHYNYDAILGFCKNFSWSFRADGGYDCTTTVISIGEIVESLQVLLDVTSHDSSASSSATKSKDENAQATILQGVLTYIKNWSQVDAWEQTKKSYPKFAAKFTEVNDGVAGFSVARLGVKGGDSITMTDGTKKQTGAFNYITFQSFCQVINALTLVDQTGEPLARINTKIRPTNDPNTKIPSSKYKTFKYHESIDPSTCIILSPNNSYLYTYAPATYESFNTATSGDANEILNIFLHTDMVLGVLADILQKPAEERSLFAIFDTVLGKVNSALGEINELALHYDEALSTYYIVDRQVQIEDSDLKVLNITGLTSTVTKFDFVTKLSPALTTMIAISAQAGGTDVGVDASALLRWNEGLSDRVLKSKRQEKEELDKLTAESKIAAQQSERQVVYENFLQAFYKNKQFNYQKLDEAKANYSQYAKTYMNNYDDTKGKSGPAGIVPFEVGIEMDGISGIKIGEAFKINENIMPHKYNGVIGFIVTGVSHKIISNRWTTILKAQTITLSGGLTKSSSKGRERVLGGFTPTTVETNFKATPNEAKKAAENYLGKSMTDDEWSKLVSATFAEAGRTQTERGYIMAVMLNRVRSGKWGSSVTSVLTAKNQFQSVTGTAANGHRPSSNYVTGPNEPNRESIYGAAKSVLPKVPKGLIYFTSNVTAAYGKGTSLAFRDKLFKRGGVIIGDSVFSA